jgi:monofunctional biosynthetic peptidoglycan transglycosylase
MIRMLRTFSRLVGALIALMVFLAAVDAVYLAQIWPDWSRLASGSIPSSRFIQDYVARQADEPELPALRWTPVPLASIPQHVRRAVIIAEDARFYEHGGFDFDAIREAWEYNVEKGRVVRGASTISQQTAKNMFLHSGRDPLRKWHEAVLTWFMERRLSKSRILEVYLNVAELGRGVYGVEAAARTYWGKPMGALSLREAAELAATLPSPVKSNPRTRTAFFQRHADKIEERLRGVLGVDGTGGNAFEPGGLGRFMHELFSPPAEEDGAD